MPLALTLEHEGRELRIEGRADGLRSDPDGGLVVEELKSAAGAFPCSPERLDLERLQVELYAFLLARTARPPARAELVWLATDGEAGVAVAAREVVPLDLASIEARLRGLLRGVVADARRREGLLAARRALAGSLAFPFAVPRPGQRAIREAVERALGEGRHLLLEAPTGIGKTAAVLLPALAHAFREGGRVFLLTSRGGQQRGAVAAAERLAPPGSAAAALLRPKAELCASGTLLCHEDDCAFARGYGRKLAEHDLLAQAPGSATRAPPRGRPRRRARGRGLPPCPRPRRRTRERAHHRGLQLRPRSRGGAPGARAARAPRRRGAAPRRGAPGARARPRRALGGALARDAPRPRRGGGVRGRAGPPGPP